MHLFWECPVWQTVRLRHLTDSQLAQSARLPLCTRRTGLFIHTSEQCAQVNTVHVQALAGQPTDKHIAHTCDFSIRIHQMMIDIIKNRNNSSTSDVPDDFDPSFYKRPDPKQNPPVLIANDSQPSEPSQPTTDVPKPMHSPEGFLLSTSNRPGGSKFQYVQYQVKNQKYKVCIPHAGKRHSFGPFLTELEAAKTVKHFLQSIQDGSVLPTRGEKRTITFHHTLEEKLNQLNLTARDEKRHKVTDADNPTCSFCQTSVHTYYALKFASQPCSALTDAVDKRGSSTRASKLSETRTAVLQSDIDAHNLHAFAKNQHYICSLDPPRCKYCRQTVTRGYVRKWMSRHCPSVHETHSSDSKTPIVTKRLRGKQPAATSRA